MTVDKGEEQPLAPGAYLDGHVRPQATLHVGTGTYDFRSLDVKPEGSVRLDTAEGDVTLRVAQGLSVGSRSNIYKAGPGRVRIHVCGDDAIHIGPKARMDAWLMAPSADVMVLPDTTVNGCVVGSEVRYQPRVVQVQ